MEKEKKEIGIEKLIELLNEYHHFNSDLIYYGWDEEYERVYFHTELPEEQKKKLAKAGIDDEGIDEQRVYDEWICSKKFGFIKWLVENDKIDFDNRDLKDRFMNEFERYPQFQNNTTNREFNVNGLLMLLSIQDEPIRFLCEILK